MSGCKMAQTFWRLIFSNENVVHDTLTLQTGDVSTKKNNKEKQTKRRTVTGYFKLHSLVTPSIFIPFTKHDFT